MSTVVVTGAGGHIGRRLVTRLAAEGVPVRAQVRREVSWPSGVEQVVGDLVTEAGLAKELAHDVDLVIHLAGANEAALAADPAGALADSVLAAARVAAAGAARAVFLSTVHVYGDALGPGAVIDEATPVAPVTPYAATRSACEEVFRQSDLPSMILRLTNGIGAPHQADGAGWRVVTNDLCRQGATEGVLTLHTSGLQWRDFVPLVDVERALCAVVAPSSFRAGTYNFASGTSITVLAMAGEIQTAFERVTGTRPPLQVGTGGAVRSDPYRIDPGALDALGLFVPTPRLDAVDELVRHCVSQQATLR